MAAVLILLIGVFCLAFLPQMWVKGILKRHGDDRPDIEGTGGQFARHLLDRLGLKDVGVEVTKLGDHYDPEAKIVRLSEQHFGARSLSALVVAAHEVGHAMQDATGYAPLQARTRLAKQAHNIERFGAVVMLAAPIVMLLARSPHVLILELLVGVLILGTTVLMHAVTLPVEFDASFKRALPLLKTGKYVPESEMPAAKQILRAAAFTYVASAAISLLDVMRWLRVLRM